MVQPGHRDNGRMHFPGSDLIHYITVYHALVRNIEVLDCAAVYLVSLAGLLVHPASVYSLSAVVNPRVELEKH